MSYTPIVRGAENWDEPVNEAFTDQDNRITTNTINIATNTGNISSLTTTVSGHTTSINDNTSAISVINSTLDSLERQPHERGYKSWTQQPETTQSVGTAPPSGVMRLQRHKIRTAETITNLHVGVLTVGATLTAGQNLMGIYDTAGNLLAQTGDQSVAWTSLGLKTAALTSPLALPAGDFYVGFLSVGTTPPAFARGHDNSSSFINGLTASGQHLYISHGAGLTALPATITLTTTSGTAFWTGTS